MNDFLKKVIEGSDNSPSTICLEAFNQNFQDAVNIDWYKRDDYYEAIFYKDSLEHIANFDFSGNLIEYKLFLPDGFLPESIKTIAESKGEIMNSVMKNKGNSLEYEIIIRDENLKRYLLHLSDLGKVIDEIKL